MKIDDPAGYLASNGIHESHVRWKFLVSDVHRYNEACDNISELVFSPNNTPVMKRIGIMAGKYNFPGGIVDEHYVRRLRELVSEQARIRLKELNENITSAKAVKGASGYLLFWSWQSEYNESSKEIGSTLKDIMTFVNSHLPPERQIEVSGATRVTEGAIDIARGIRDKATTCRIFVADVTPIWSVQGDGKNKFFPNPNVCFELGLAMESHDENQMVLVAKKRPEAEFQNGAFPFDFEHYRRVSYTGKSELRRDLAHALFYTLLNLKIIDSDEFTTIKDKFADKK